MELGSLDRFDGTIIQTNLENAKEAIKTLVNNEEWKSAIQKSRADNCKYYSLEDFGVQDPKYEKWSIAPSLHITKNDCDCCS